jgi:serine/threonine protein kinase
VVYLARSPSGQDYAVKVLRAGWTADPEARRRLAREVAAATQVAPFCTAQVIEAQLDGDLPYVVTEFVDGPTLAAQVQRHGPLRGGDLHRVAIGAATALVAIHTAKVVHRDFKPSNVILGPLGPRVIDFGIARNLIPSATVTQQVIGTPHYMAPEQFRGAQIGPPADLFAWACTIAFAATGRATFAAGSVAAIAHRITSGPPDLAGIERPLSEVLARCLAKEPKTRPTAQETLLALLGGSLPLPSPDPTSLLTQGLARTLTAVSTHLASRSSDAPAPGAPTPDTDTGTGTGTGTAPRPAARPVARTPARPAPTAPQAGQPRRTPATPVRRTPATPVRRTPATPVRRTPVPPPAVSPYPVPPVHRTPVPPPAVSPYPVPPVQQTPVPPPAVSPYPVPPVHPGDRPSSGWGSRLIGLVAIGLAVALLVIGYLNRGTLLSGSPTGGMSGAGSSPSPASVSDVTGAEDPSLPKASPGSSCCDGTVPSQYANTWTGELNSSGTYLTDVKVILEAGDKTGQIQYLQAECSGIVTVDEVAEGGSFLTLSEAITDDPNNRCPNGTITLAPDSTDHDDGRLWMTFEWKDPDHPRDTMTGNLQGESGSP